jgi:hypothetical protein
MGMWEWMQSPFFKDFSDNLNEIVFFRIHCTLGDVLILYEIAVLLSLIRLNWKWLLSPRRIDYILVTVLGVAYTIFSEYRNVHIRGSWSYSDIMPLVPLLKVGLVPLLQWIILPSIIISMTKTFVRGRVSS